jgi:hypothetical protein
MDDYKKFSKNLRKVLPLTQKITIIENRRLTPEGVKHYTDRLQAATAELLRVTKLMERMPNRNLKTKKLLAEREIELCRNKLQLNNQ